MLNARIIVMIKVCSLDFLNRDVFGVDIKDNAGEVLYSSDELVSPELILKLYYRNIYVDSLEPMAEIPMGEFDEEEAKNVAKYSLLVGKFLGYADKELQDLELAAYYHNVGNTRLPASAVEEDDFIKRRADEGYNYLLTVKALPENVAKVAKLYLRDYDCINFDLSKKQRVNIPLYHIVAIASYYNRSLKTMPKEEVMMKMLRLGGNKFNIYVLHKFINIMRNNND